jgi:hypothetical protein
MRGIPAEAFVVLAFALLIVAELAKALGAGS